MFQGRPLLAIASALFLLAVAIGHGLLRCDLEIVNRYGTLIVIAGLVVDYWPLLRTKIADDVPAWRGQEAHDANRTAIVIVCLGTLVQGFGGWIVGAIVQAPSC